ncbi:MAG: NlpC/P60 family protein [Corynebacterium sp.]|uniref:DIP1281 family NlpC/P60 protein n=1 Tax=Corynebacterium sp. TaxID=1720 RepID=UPI0026DDAFDD|nr:NlpC/P60 family protein [Corynebacterium sp.]MDO4760407.1 NlpC/P60 family protein [Corynebacterium sp.]
MSTLGRRWAAVTVVACLTAVNPFALAEPTNPSDSDITQAHSAVNEAETNVSSLIATIATSNAELNAMEMEMGRLREAVNKSLVDYHDAQHKAAEAREGVTEARSKLEFTQSEMVKAQETLDEISRSTYRQGATSVVGGIAGTTNTEDALDRQTYLRTNAAKQKKLIDDLDRLRTQQANEESLLREARNIAQAREEEAKQAKEDAEHSFERNSAEIARRQAEHQKLEAERNNAQIKLELARSNASALNTQRSEYLAYQEAEQARVKAAEEARRAEEERHKLEEQARAKAQAQAEAEAAAKAAAEAEKQARAESERKQAAEQKAKAQAEAQAAKEAAEKAAQAAQQQNNDAQQAAQQQQQAAEAAAKAAQELLAAATQDQTATTPSTDNTGVPNADSATQSTDTGTVDLGDQSPQTTTPAPEQSQPSTDSAVQNALEDIFVVLDDLANSTSNASTAVISGDRSAKIEAVIARAQSQIGTPYAWGGGNAHGPTKGIRDGGTADRHGDYNKVGFDCSGLVLYAFAAAGISLPHYTGYQYQRGTKINPKEMQRGDLIFYGPNAEHHVAIYLGDGTMIEAPQSGSTVRISPVRWGGMSPYAVRLI